MIQEALKEHFTYLCFDFLEVYLQQGRKKVGHLKMNVMPFCQQCYFEQ